MREMKDSGYIHIGEIPTDWKTAPIKYYSSIFCGSFVIKTLQDDDYQYPVFNGGMGNTGNYQKYNYDGDLILVSSRGSAGYTYYYQGKCWIGNSCYAIKTINDIVDWRYLYYSLKNNEDNLSIERQTTTIPAVSQEQMRNSKIAFPPKAQQQAIAKFLDSTCSEIDALSADIQSEIDTLEAFKQSIITEAVTKGLDKSVPMKDTGIPWLGEVPAHWEIARIADLYCDRNERGNEELALLTVSINSGVSDKELSEDEQLRAFVRSEDKTKYKRVYPGDLTYNMMRAWQGAFGAVRVPGMVSPAYVVAKPKGNVQIDSRYIEALLRSPMGICEMDRYSYGIMDFRKRLYWPQFRIIKICLPGIEEQIAIADYIDTKSAEIEAVIEQKKEQISTLLEYKKSVIYEYVTGKKKIPVYEG